MRGAIGLFDALKPETQVLLSAIEDVRIKTLPHALFRCHIQHAKENVMFTASDIQEHSEVIGKDGRHVGTVDRVEGDRIKLTKADSQMAGHAGHHHYVAMSLVEDVQDNRVHLSVDSAEVLSREEEKDRRPVH